MIVVFATLNLFLAFFVHEFCHGWAAIRQGLPIKAIYIGYPVSKRWLKKIPIKGYNVYFSPFMFGGGILIEDEIYWSTTLRKKVIVDLYGPAGNLLLGFALALLLEGANLGTVVIQEMLVTVAEATKMLVLGQVALTDIVGPVGVIQITTWAMYAEPWRGWVLMAIIINFAIAGMNLLPFPVFDGFRVFVSFVYTIPWTKTYVRWVAERSVKISAVILIAGMIFITLRDITNVFN